MMRDDSPRCSPLDLLAAMRDPAIPPSQVKLLCIYRSYEDERGLSWPGDPRVARHMGTSIRQMHAHRKRLLDSGWLQQHLNTGPGGNAEYRVVLDPEDQARIARGRRERRERLESNGNEASNDEAPTTGSPASDGNERRSESPLQIGSGGKLPMDEHEASDSDSDPCSQSEVSGVAYKDTGEGTPFPSPDTPTRDRTSVRERASEASQQHSGRGDAPPSTPLHAEADTKQGGHSDTRESPPQDEFVDYDPKTDTGYV